MLKWVLLFAVGYVIYRGLMRPQASSQPRSAQRGGEQMVECAHCHIRFPESEAVHSEEKIFCSEQHRASWLQAR